MECVGVPVTVDKAVTHWGCVQSCRLHILRMGLGFLPASQYPRWTIFVSPFFLQPYLVYWNPAKERRTSAPAALRVSYGKNWIGKTF